MNISTPNRLSDCTIAFLGAGSMSEALLRGIIEAKLIHPQSVIAINRSNTERLQELRSAYGVRVPESREADERAALLQSADIVVLAMKPKDVGSAIRECKNSFRPDQLIVSVVAGLSIETLEQLLGRPQPIVRTMPNTSSTIGLGATGLACSSSVTPVQRELAMEMLAAVGKAVMLDEEKLNLVTGLSGSGPAYVYLLMEAMIEAGVQGGLSEQDAKTLVVQTILGAARMVELTGEDPAVLRAKVTSPNGTTQAGLEVLSQLGFRDSVIKAVRRAAERSEELGRDIADAVLER